MNQKLSLRIRLIIWFATCLAILLLSFGELLAKLPQWLSPEGIQSRGVFHWGVLGLCLLWLWLKRRDILPKMQINNLGLPISLIGVALLVLSVSWPRSDDFLVFWLLLGGLGTFIMLFPEAYLIPSLLLAIYGFAVAFPLFMIRWQAEPSGILAAVMVDGISRLLGLPIIRVESQLYFTGLTGAPFFLNVAPACVGYTSLSVFMAIFALMMLDVRLPFKTAWYIFLIGLVGTWLQNLLRIVIIVMAGYLWGWDALEAAHNNISYFIFPLWYALFAYIYLRKAKASLVSIKA